MTEPLDPQAYDAVIFDLGGVLLSLFPERTVSAFSELFARDASVAYTQAKQAVVFDRFERGEIDPNEFRTRVHEFFSPSSQVPNDAFDEAWNAMLGRIPEENLLLLRSLGRTRRLFLLSNTNSIHIERFLSDYRSRHEVEHGAWHDLFEAAHYSHDLAMRKPEERIFEELIRRHDLNAKRTLFVDDNQANVESARKVGLRGVFHPTNAPLAARFIGLEKGLDP